MPVRHRPKLATIYNLVNEWWRNAGGVDFVAHAITAGPAAHLLAAVTHTDGNAGGQPYNHPDQAFWRQNGIANAINNAGGAGAILRVEVDCSLMPCSAGNHCCLYLVPHAIQQILPGKAIRMYSHRLEIAQAGVHSKRLIRCNANDTRHVLDQAGINTEGWSWAPWAGLYP